MVKRKSPIRHTVRPIPGRRAFVGKILIYPKEKVTEIEPTEKGLGTPDKILLRGKSLKRLRSG